MTITTWEVKCSNPGQVRSKNKKNRGDIWVLYWVPDVPTWEVEGSNLGRVRIKKKLRGHRGLGLVLSPSSSDLYRAITKINYRRLWV